MFSTRTVFSGVFDSVVAVDCVFDPLIESSLSCDLKFFVKVSLNFHRKNLYLPRVMMMMTVVKSVRWRMQQVILAHLTYPRIFAVCVAVEFALETVVLNLGCGFAQVLVHFFVTDGMIDFNAGLSGTGTFGKIC